MNIYEQIENFQTRFSDVTTSPAPNWVEAVITHRPTNAFKLIPFDFKNDEARRAFGALCHAIYTCKNRMEWSILTYCAEQ